MNKNHPGPHSPLPSRLTRLLKRGGLGRLKIRRQCHKLSHQKLAVMVALVANNSLQTDGPDGPRPDLKR
jgi:hypothetical protein